MYAIFLLYSSMMPLGARIEAVLFYKTEPVTTDELSSFFGVSKEDIEREVGALRERLSDGGTRLIETGSAVQLVSAPEAATDIERLRKEELSREIGKAGAETLAIIVYRGPLERSAIDFIRGVNSSFILRNLQIRGLIERIPHPTLSRSFQYAATPSLLAHLGVTKKEELPEYAAVMAQIETYEQETVAQDA